MIRNLIFFVCLILLVAPVSGMKLSPLKAQLEINSDENCSDYWIEPPKNVEIKIFWSGKRSSNPQDYTLQGDELKITERIEQKSLGEYKICFEPLHNGEYYGLIWFYGDELIEMGSWIKLDVYGKKGSIGKSIQKKITLVSGKAIEETNGTEIILGGVLLSLIGLLAFIFVIVRK